MSNKKERKKLVERWDGFIEKIKCRCDELIGQANAGTDMFIPQLRYDINAVSNAWTGIKGHVFQLSDKLSEGWDKMDELFDEAESSKKETKIERKKKEKTDIYIHWQFEKNQTIALANAAKRVLENVMAHVDKNKMHQCTQCGSPLDVVIYSFMAKNIKCEACSSVNTYQPDDRIKALESWVLIPLANEHVLPEKEKEFYLEEKIGFADHRKVKEDDLASLITFREVRIEKFYKYLINSVPEKEEYYKRQRDERLEWARVVKY